MIFVFKTCFFLYSELYLYSNCIYICIENDICICILCGGVCRPHEVVTDNKEAARPLFPDQHNHQPNPTHTTQLPTNGMPLSLASTWICVLSCLCLYLNVCLFVLIIAIHQTRYIWFPKLKFPVKETLYFLLVTDILYLDFLYI